MLRAARILISVLILTTAFGLFSCYLKLGKKEVQDPEKALRPIRFFYPAFLDDMHPESLIQAIKRSIEYLNRVDPEAVFHYGPHEFTCRQVRESQDAFLKIVSKGLGPDQMNREIKRQFRVYRASGRAGNNKVLFTGYFEPVFAASLTPDRIFKHPIYRKPDDLVRIDLSIFDTRLKGKTIVARIAGKEVVPYHTRYHIEVEKALEGRNLEIAWLKDPLDLAFLHIQGSGRLRLPDGEFISVGYHASNGRSYRSIGRYMLEKGFVEPEEMSMQKIRSYLSEHPEVMAEVLNYNPSYVFFQEKENGPFGNLNVALTPGRSLALDYRLFPKGALAFIDRKSVV